MKNQLQSILYPVEENEEYSLARLLRKANAIIDVPKMLQTSKATNIYTPITSAGAKSEQV